MGLTIRVSSQAYNPNAACLQYREFISYFAGQTYSTNSHVV